jgi:hypothetical protein
VFWAAGNHGPDFAELASFGFFELNFELKSETSRAAAQRFEKVILNR